MYFSISSFSFIFLYVTSDPYERRDFAIVFNDFIWVSIMIAFVKFLSICSLVSGIVWICCLFENKNSEIFFQIFMVGITQMMAFWVFTLCGVIHLFRYFGRTFSLHLQGEWIWFMRMVKWSAGGKYVSYVGSLPGCGPLELGKAEEGAQLALSQGQLRVPS